MRKLICYKRYEIVLSPKVDCFIISMQNIADFLNSAIKNYHIDSSAIQNVQGCLRKEMKVDGWILLILSNRERVVLRFENGVFMNEGFVVNDEKVLKVYGNHQIGQISYSEGALEEGIVDLDHGSRFEGLVLKDGKIGIPFGNGEMYDDNGVLIYKGIMINWKRFGYGTSYHDNGFVDGTSYHDNGFVEYEGYWCDDNRFGIGKVYDRSGKFVKECEWVNGIESIINYEGDGSEPLNIGMKHLKLTDNCALVDWNVSWFLNLESIEIGNNCFGSVLIFRIDGLNQLKSLKIGINSFTKREKYSFIIRRANKQSKSFHILNCESLESIQIGEYSFSDYGGEFELKNLPQLQTIQIGTVGSKSCNFYDSSFMIRGIAMILKIIKNRSSKSTIHHFG